MYLKNIEVQGFKSFAHKIVFDFHNGITAIVGPNGSGKSNVADAVRWVLGEQRVKQLRGGNMQDVIFSGTENRKPLSYAYVAITLDNSDHQLAIEYEEVTVSRRIYRSGESEYLINGTVCRLKDVNELFYDTGIGKEGYSIIGQGQIDRILSSKPEEARELFDEATGIVKFKRRKKIAQKKLEDEKLNITRINDILTELGKQLGPLERQSEIAKKYLKKKETLKIYDVNMFLLEVERIRLYSQQIEQKYQIADADLKDTSRAYENIKLEHAEVEKEIENINLRIEETREASTKSGLQKQQMEGQIEVLREQINSVRMNDEHLQGRLSSIASDLQEKALSREALLKEKSLLDELLLKTSSVSTESEEKLISIQTEIGELNFKIETYKNEIIEILNERASIKGKLQRFDTMQEQIQIRKAELNQRILQAKSDEEDQNVLLENYNKELEKTCREIVRLSAEHDEKEELSESLRKSLIKLNDQLEIGRAAFHRESSKLESLKNMTERYDGYGSSIRKVMERKDSKKGILGVVADIIKVEKSYEVAIETALGGNIQNIVTDNENTAKEMITYLKENKFGRATFLPLTSVGNRDNFPKKEALEENGVIGIASSLVRTDDKYEGIVKFLLGRVLVVDSVDTAIHIAKKYSHSLHIVTKEGEYLSPGGSMTGGTFKNTSNLLGRRREIEELEESVKLLSGELEQALQAIEETKDTRRVLKEEIEEFNVKLQEQYLQQNTGKMNVDQTILKRDAIIAGFSSLQSEIREIEVHVQDIQTNQNRIQLEVKESEAREAATETLIGQSQLQKDELHILEESYRKESADIHLEVANVTQKVLFANENITRINGEMQRLLEEETELKNGVTLGDKDIQTKESSIRVLAEEIKNAVAESEKLDAAGQELTAKREKLLKGQKAFFTKREELSERMGMLDKEVFRLNSQREKLEETSEYQMNYMWEEYELTYNAALPMRTEEFNDPSMLKREISAIKDEIRKLGDVNVNSIEDFKNISERYEFMNGQRNDLVKAEETLLGIIDELDAGMRRQFKEQFEKICVEFDKVFKELFGGGKGTLEINEEEDILEAGIRIIAQPPGKKLQNMMQLSGGEKALTAISLLFAIQNLKPSPFCLLDEIEAALDDSNVNRFAKYLHRLTKSTQFIIITHRKGTMEAADRLYGITMQEKGVSALVSVNMIEEELSQ